MGNEDLEKEIKILRHAAAAEAGFADEAREKAMRLGGELMIERAKLENAMDALAYQTKTIEMLLARAAGDEEAEEGIHGRAR